MSQSLHTVGDAFHFVASTAGSSRPLDKSSRRFLAERAARAKCRRDETPLKTEKGSAPKRYSAKLGPYMSSWRLKTNGQNGQNSQKSPAFVTELSLYDNHSNLEKATNNRATIHYRPECCGLGLQVLPNPDYGVEPWATDLLNYYLHMLVMWRYPTKFRSFSSLFCPPYAEQETSYSLQDRSNFFTTLAVASSHLQMYKRELGFEPFDIQLGLPVNRYAYYSVASLEAIRHDVCNYSKMSSENKSALIWAICKLALADLFCNDFAAAKIHLAAIANIIRQAGGEWPNIEEYQKHMLFVVDVNTAAMFLEMPLFPAKFQRRSCALVDFTLVSTCDQITNSTRARGFSEIALDLTLDMSFLQIIISRLHHTITVLEHLMGTGEYVSNPEYVEWVTYNINALDHKILTEIASLFKHSSST